MTEALGPLHPATRLGRVEQQVRSFATMHATELEALAADIEAAGQAELAARLRTFRDLQAQETRLVLDEVSDIRADLAAAAAPPVESRASAGASTSTAGDAETASSPAPTPAPGHPAASPSPSAPTPDPEAEPAARVDPAARSPRRQRWLAQQAAEQALRAAPRGRRALFTRPTDRST